MVNWMDYQTKTPITDISQFHSNVIGFIYLIHFTDNTSYIGKKNLYSIRKLPVLKSGKTRKGVIRQYTNKVKGVKNEVVAVESNWKKYQGSQAECKTKIPKTKYILDYADTKLQLTYLEAKYLFSFGVLEDTQFLNDNILGKFYRENLHGTITTEVN